MRRYAAGFATCALLALAGTAVAQEEANPFNAIQETVDALTASDEKQDAQIFALKVGLSNERVERTRNQRQLARCGMRTSGAWRQNADGTWRLGEPRRTRAWKCFHRFQERL